MELAISDQEHRMYRELLGAYALDATTSEEHAAVESHLAECSTCREEVETLRMVASLLPMTVDERVPPASLRGSILSAIGHPQVPQPESIGSSAPVVDLPAQRSRRNWLPWAAAAALALLSVGLLAWNFVLREESTTPEPTAIAFEPMAEDVDTAAAGMYMEDAGVIKVWLTEDPALADDEVLQLWLINNAGEAVPAGIMTKARSPIAVVANPDDIEMLAITREPGPMGMPSPSSAPILTAHVESG